MIRIALALFLCALALALGVLTALQAVENRARAADLARRHGLCETLERRNQLQRAENAREAWLVLHDAPQSPAPAAASAGREGFEN